MSWLIAEKVAPPLMPGDRPQAADDSDPALRAPVSWQLLLNDKPLGWASTDQTQRPDGVVELHNRVHLNRFPLKEIAPWLARMLDAEDDTGTPLDTDTRIELSEGRLLGFRTSIGYGNLSDAILVNGRAAKDLLKINLRAGEFRYDTQTRLSADAPLADSLSPRTRLQNLRVGQTWTEPVYNPLQPPNSPLEILQAKVERREPIGWNGRIVNSSVVVYRNDPGSEKNTTRTLRARAWVASDGEVLRQEIFLLGVKLVFVRMPPGATMNDIANPPDAAAASGPS